MPLIARAASSRVRVISAYFSGWVRRSCSWMASASAYSSTRTQASQSACGGRRTVTSSAPRCRNTSSAASIAATASGSPSMSRSWKWRTTPMRMPSIPPLSPRVKLPTRVDEAAGSAPSGPAIRFIASAQSSTVQASGPQWSRLKASGTTPVRGTTP